MKIHSKRRTVYRTVKNGKVKVNGRYFSPRADYDGRFEGMRLCFGLYWSYNELDEEYMEDFIFLWGTEETAKSINTEEYEENRNKDVELFVVDGKIQFLWWDEV